MNESTPQTQAASYACTASEACAWTASQLAELNRHLDKPFGEVERFNQALAFTLWMDGHPVEWFHDFGGYWWPLQHRGNCWSPESRYRVLPKPEPLVLPSIDWSHVAPKWTWLAQDNDGDLYVYANEPTADESGWYSSPYEGCDILASAKPGTGDWKKLIVQRPEGV